MKKRRSLQSVRSSDVQEADLFFADLVGIAPPSRAAAAPRAPQYPDLFYAEQPAATAAPLPAPIATRWSGVDRRSISGPVVGRRVRADPGWMGTLIDNSNLRFTGAYVTGPPPPGHQAGDFTPSSRDTNRGWIANLQTVADQGWGIAFFYVGYSVAGNEPAPPGTGRARGIEHGLHLRTTLHALGPAWAGAVVFIDNEDIVGTPITRGVEEYYVGLFDEMSRPDPNLAAFRPALYGHGQQLEQMLRRRPDLFLWEVRMATRTTVTPNAPFDPAVDPITVDPVARPIHAYRGTPAGRPACVTWALGRQYWSYSGQMPAKQSAVARRLPHWRREGSWDYDTCLVRDPAFPVGEPRIGARPHGRDAVVVADFFVARGTGATATPPTVRVTTQGPARSAAIATAAGVTVEPDAPLALFPRRSELLLATVLAGGGIGIATRNAAGAWTAIDRIGGSVPALRRSRAVQGASNATSNVHVFFIGADDRLYVKRLTGTGGWSDGQMVNADLRLHPFSALAGEARRADTVDTFFIDDQGLLSTAYWARWFTTPFPGFLVQRLQTTPSLLPDGALAVICPHFDHLLVFGIGDDQRLQFASFVHGRGWSAVTPAGGTSDLIGVHTRLAAHAVSATEVEVAALTDAGQLVIYPVQRTGTTWSVGARQVIGEPPLAALVPATTPNGLLQSAAGFRINPFGDLSILQPAGGTRSTVLCAGLRGGEARTLKWNAGDPDPWQSFA